jgi:hypothetical protein
MRPVSRRNLLLDRQRRLDRLDHAGELDQRPVAHQLDQPPAALSDHRVEHLRAVRLERRQRPGLVVVHERRVADHVGSKNRGETARHTMSPSDRRLA